MIWKCRERFVDSTAGWSFQLVAAIEVEGSLGRNSRAGEGSVVARVDDPSSFVAVRAGIGDPGPWIDGTAGDAGNRPGSAMPGPAAGAGNCSCHSSRQPCTVR